MKTDQKYGRAMKLALPAVQSIRPRQGPRRLRVLDGGAAVTHIIGKPPAPKQGATFADVPIRKGRKSLFVGRSDVAYIRMNRFEAIRCDTFETVEFTRDNEPVTLLDVTPRDPEPDPAVVEYEGVWRGEFFTDGPQVSPQDCTGLHMRGWDDECTRVSDGKHATAPSDARSAASPLA